MTELQRFHLNTSLLICVLEQIESNRLITEAHLYWSILCCNFDALLQNQRYKNWQLEKKYCKLGTVVCSSLLCMTCYTCASNSPWRGGIWTDVLMGAI